MRHLAQRVALQTLRAYKWAVSPMFPAACRYTPTCSEYAMEAIERHGVLRGGLKAAARLLRCHPFVKGGYDPVVKPDWRSVVEEWPFEACPERSRRGRVRDWEFTGL